MKEYAFHWNNIAGESLDVNDVRPHGNVDILRKARHCERENEQNEHRLPHGLEG
jgi:hypothetical protein